MLSDRCLSVMSCLSVLSVTLMYCGQMVGWIKTKLGRQISLSPSHIVLDEDPASPPQRGTVPQFSAHICCGQMAGWIKMPHGREVGLDPSNIVRWGPSSSAPKRGTSPNFRPMSIVAKRLMDQDATWYGGRPRLRPHYVRWGPSSPLKWAQPPLFGGFLLWPNGSMDQDATWYESRPRPGQHCVRCGPTSTPAGHSRSTIFGLCLFWPIGWMDQDAIWYECRPRPRPHCVTWGPSAPKNTGAQHPLPNFRHMSIVAKRSPISATVEHLLHSSQQCRQACPGMSVPLKIAPLYGGSGPI